MADSTHIVGANFELGLVKAPGLRISDVASSTTTDYAEIIVGSGVPSGGYGRDSSATMLYLRTDAPTVGHAKYRTIDGGTTWRPIGGLLYASTAASTAITGATEAETIFDTNYSLPANSCAAGSVFRIRGQGIHTATTGTETHTIALKFGSVTLALKASVDPANNDIFVFDATVVIRTIGASGTLVATSRLARGASDTASPVEQITASTTIDTTAAIVIGVYIDRQTTATDADSARLDILTVEMVG